MKQLKRCSGENVEKWMRTFNVSKSLSPTRQFIRVKENNTEHFADIGLSDKEYGKANEELIEETEHGKNFLVYPSRDSIGTFSLFSAFVVKAIIGSGKLNASRAEFLYNFLLAQKFAFLHLPSCSEFSGIFYENSTDRSLITMADKFYGERRKTLAAPSKLEIKNLRRVTSVLVWRRTVFGDIVQTLAMSRPFPFDTNFSRVPKQKDFTYFVYGNETSVKFTAAAQLMIRFDLGRIQEITHVATASGSIRTIEAVSLAILNLYKGESPDNVVAMKSAYYDIRDGKFYCEDKADIAELFAAYKLVCNEIPKDDFDANDRVLMVAVLSERGNAMRTSITAAMNSRDEDGNKDYNEPVSV
ncbi:unnamed protein product [Cylicocyclus nassatus]|uniref:Uncharacterized protein n=1 Tax=Cylicocyclus nassatus TaxID=53992 RepID=A0AA36DUR3_CYLNA|nr:unnamed protein product [Cylicocyclus nassatus]